MTIDKVLQDRGRIYGKFKHNAEVAQKIKHIFRKSYNWEGLPVDMQEALDMTASKISRILTGDYNHKDNWVDLVGYSQLILKEFGE